MMTTIRRVAVVLASVAAIAAAGAGSVRAAEPTLGATVEADVYVRDDAHLTIWNRSTVEARFDLLPSGGWSVEPSSLVLAPDEKRDVAVSGDGDDGATVTVVVRATAPAPPGHSMSVVQVSSRVYHVRPTNWLSVALTALAVLVGLAGLAFGLRRARPWELRVTRSSR